MLRGLSEAPPVVTVINTAEALVCPLHPEVIWAFGINSQPVRVPRCRSHWKLCLWTVALGTEDAVISLKCILYKIMFILIEFKTFLFRLALCILWTFYLMNYRKCFAPTWFFPSSSWLKLLLMTLWNARVCLDSTAFGLYQTKEKLNAVGRPLIFH